MALANRSIGYDEVEARDLRFNLDKDSVPRFWMNGDPWSTHFFNSILAAVPDGERWVMQCVRSHLVKLKDEKVRKAGVDFIKQEHYHAREHDIMNAAVAKHGDAPMLRPSTTMEMLWRAKHFPMEHYRFSRAQGGVTTEPQDHAAAAA